LLSPLFDRGLANVLYTLMLFKIETSARKIPIVESPAQSSTEASKKKSIVLPHKRLAVERRSRQREFRFLRFFARLRSRFFEMDLVAILRGCSSNIRAERSAAESALTLVSE
jgi:hypothetical protein